MRYSEYVEASGRTAPDLGETGNKMHAALGMLSELGELADAFKRELAYGKAVDSQNVLEEVGDFLWYLALHLRNHSMQADDTLFDVDEGDIAYVLTAAAPDLINTVRLSPLAMASLQRVLHTGEHSEVIQAIRMTMIYVATILKHYGFTLEQAMQANIDKLMVRYPEKFTQDNALTRNIEAEMQAMEKAIESRDD